MNNDQLKYIATPLSALGLAQFVAFSYASLQESPRDWVLVAVSVSGFVNIQAFAVWVLSSVKGWEVGGE